MLFRSYYDKLTDCVEKLEADTIAVEAIEDMEKASFFYHDTIIPTMEEIRVLADEAETLLPDGILPYPSYEELLFSI